MKIISQWTIPKMKILSVSNLSESFWTKFIRNKNQKNMMRAYFLKEKPKIELPCLIRLTRIAPRKLDQHDNLPSSFKWIVDALADCIIPNKMSGRADDSKEITWIYHQEKGAPKEYSVRVEIWKND